MKQKGFSVVELLVVLVVIGLIGGAGWVVYHKLNKPKTAEATLSRLTSDAKNSFANADFRAQDAWAAEMSATGFTNVSGYDYKISSAGKSINWVIEGDDTAKTVKKWLIFKKTLQPANTVAQVEKFAKDQLVSYGFTTSDHETFKKGDVTCTVLNDPAGLSGSDLGEPSNVVDVNCFDGHTLRDTAVQMKPFVDQYIKANPSVKASDLSVGPLTIKSKNGSGVISSSHAAGYDIAELVVSTKSKKQIALYYAKDANISNGENSGWHYVTQADDEFGFRCGFMKANPDARKALYDQVCLSENGQVRLDTNNRALQ